jgi:hypothetical protein
LMYQGHIPPSQRMAPWEAYYAKSRVPYIPTTVPPTPLHINTQFYQPYDATVAVKQPITPPMTPGVPQAPYYHLQKPATPTSPTLPYSRQGTFSTGSSFDSVHSIPSQVVNLGMPHGIMSTNI